MYVDVTNIVNSTVESRIAGRCRNVDRSLLYEDVRIGEIKVQPPEDLPACADRRVDSVVVRNIRLADLVRDR